MPKFRKKPVEIEAVQWTGDNVDEIAEFMNLRKKDLLKHPFAKGEKLIIETLEGTLTAPKNHWIIKGVEGEFYPCDPDIFEKTYDPVYPEYKYQEDPRM